MTNTPTTQVGWYRVCWEISRDGHAWEVGTLTGLEVPSMLVSLRDCFR